MPNEHQINAREIAHQHLAAGDPLGWFEDLYSRAARGEATISWADMLPNPNLLDWFCQNASFPTRGRALVIGCGFGDDTEELSRRGFETTAFDISSSAIAECKKRFPLSSVSYAVADLFAAPSEWSKHFDFVLEAYTLQVLPPDIRPKALQQIASFVSPGGTLLIIARGRNTNEDKGNLPWPLTREEINCAKFAGLKECSFEDYMDKEEPPVRRFRAVFRQPANTHW